MTDFTSSIRRELLKEAITSKAERVLYKTGAYGLQVIRRSIRPARKKKDQTVVVGKRRLLVPAKGLVVDAKTKKPVPKKLAAMARRTLSANSKEDGTGKPPRRGPTDNLRKAEKFVVDLDTYEVTAGPIIFGKQPKLVDAADVPELLEGGGSEQIGDELVQYSRHPFVEPALEKAKQRIAQLVESEQLR